MTFKIDTQSKHHQELISKIFSIVLFIYKLFFYYLNQFQRQLLGKSIILIISRGKIPYKCQLARIKICRYFIEEFKSS